MKDFNQSDVLLREQYRDATKLYDRIRLHQRFSVNPEPLWEWVWRLVRLPANARILEVGSGPAHFWLTNHHQVPEGWEIVLSDFSPGMIQQARENLGDARHRYTFLCVNVMDIPFPDQYFDGVFANFMLYHAPNLDGAIRELHRVLKPGGRLYAATNGSGHMKQLKDLLRQLDPKAWLVGVETSFGLENGYDALRRYFPVVNSYHYDDALQVTEVEPLVAYALSGGISELLGRDSAPLREAIQQVIAREGMFFIQKRSGLFEAIKTLDADNPPSYHVQTR